MLETVAIPIGIKQSIDDIFAGVILGGIDRKNNEYNQLLNFKIQTAKECRPKFIGRFQSNIFNNEYAIFYEIISTFNVKTFTSEQIDVIIDNNKDLILDSPYVQKSDFIGATSTVPSNDEIIFAVAEQVKAKFNELSYKAVTEQEFESACEIYTNWYINNFMFYTFNNMTTIMSDMGLDEKQPNKRTKHYQGKEDAIQYYNKNMSIVKSLSGENRITHVDIDENWLASKLESRNKEDYDAILDTGIHEIDSVVGKLRRGQMVGIMGPTKGGKTRFTVYMVYRALKKGLNVTVWPVEGSQEEWEACLAVCYIADITYEMAKQGKGGVMRIPSSEAMRGTSGNRSKDKLIAAAYTAFATDENFGRLRFMQGSPYVETLEEELTSQWDDHPYDVLVIDPLIKVLSRTKGKVEAIGEAYQTLEDVIKRKLRVKALAIIPAQLKQIAIDMLRRNPDETIDITAGGESAETIRTPDLTIGLFSSKEERNADIMRMYCVATRHNQSFDDFTARCYLDCCYFMSEDAEI